MKLRIESPRAVSGPDHETMTHVPRDTHVTKQRMAMRSNFPWSDFKKLGTPELSSSSSTSTALSPKNFEKKALLNDKSCDRASHWASVACVSIRSGSLAAWLVICLLHALLNWMSRASPCRRVSFSCLSYVHRLSYVRILTVRRASPGWLSRERHRAKCRACFAMLDVTCVFWLAT